VKATIGLLTAWAALLAAPLSAQTNSDHTSHHPDPPATAAAPMSEGEVRKVDKNAGKVTIKHGPLANLDMPSMTMVFRVKDPAMLDQVKEGDKIKFSADRIDGAITVTEMLVTK
jgi:Cu(I)/Ag(I) efflux system periplasmic protein CusF